MHVSIRLLGTFEVLADERVVIDAGFRPAKAAAIVKILALQSAHTLHRDQLIDLLWPEADADAGSSSFYKNLHHLRIAGRQAGLPDLIILNRGIVSLRAAAVLDTDTLRELGRQALARRDIPTLERALATCGGDLLPGDLYEPWSEPHRDELRTLCNRLRQELGHRYQQRGRYDDAIAQYHAVLAADALSEEAHRGLMRAFSASGQRELALRQYERCRETLATELGAVPSAETEALLVEVRRADRLRSRLDQVLSEPVAAADGAMRRQAWDEAVAQYREAIDRLHATEQDDEREAELLLKLATATSALSADPAVAEYRRRAARLAERAGAFELMARALTQFQDATDAIPNNHAGHREAAELIRAALERCPEHARASRAMLLAASARPLAAGARPDNERHVTGRLSVAGNQDPEIEGRLREAVAIARGVGKPAVLAYTLSRLRVYITSPDTLVERLALTNELVELMADSPNSVGEYEARLFRHEDLLESGDLDGARIQARAVARIGESMRLDGIAVVAMSMMATHAIADGPLAGGKKLLFESRALDARTGDNANSQFRFGIQLLMLRWHEGRIGEMYAGYRRTVDVLPRMAGARAALALICAESGRLDEARAELQELAAQPVAAIPRDYLWWQTTVCMSITAIATGERRIAGELYALIAPYADRNASVAGAVSFGSAELVLARLAAFLQRWPDAEGHFERSLSFNIRTRQRVWVARTRFHFAEMLLARDGSGGHARAQDLLRVAHEDAAEVGMAPPPLFAPPVTRVP